MSQPGQPAVTAATRLCAVYGFPIRHSASPALHNAAFTALGLDWRYLAFEVAPEDLRAALAGAKAMGFVGLNLTVPHKVLAVEMVEALDDSARRWGAVNTIRFEGRRPPGDWQPLWQFGDRPDQSPTERRAAGFNTDAEALLAALREDLNMDVRRARVLLLGAGGAGRTAALKLASESVGELFLVNRTPPKAEALAAQIRREFPEVSVRLGYPQTAVDLILNATSVGLKEGDPLPLDARGFSLRQARAVYDLIYRPAQTRLLKAARAAGCRTANGLSMLLHQGAAAFEIWTGQAAPLAAMRQALAETITG